MKGCLILQRGFAYLGHDIARHLKERHGISQFCGYVYVRSGYDFLRSQSDIPYATLLLDEEIHERFKTEKVDPDYLATLEKKFGLPFLWPYLSVDRVVMSSQLVREYPYDRPMFTHEEMLRIIQVHARAIIEMLEREKPDFLFCSVVGGVGSKLLWHISKAMGIKTYAVLMTSTRNRYALSEEYDTFTGVDHFFQNEAPRLRTSPAWTQAGAYLEEFRSAPRPYYAKSTPSAQPVTRQKQFAFLSPRHALRSIGIWANVIKNHYAAPGRNDYSTVSPWIALWDLAKRKARNLIGANDLYDTFDPKEDYAFFPLHYEPEISLLLLAPYAIDQLAVIRSIARSLPVQFTFYIKDHPEMAQFRPRSYYQALKKIPNVKLLPPTMPSFEILRNAKLVTTISGSAGWEAIMLGKPVLSLGHQYYNDLSSVKYCDTPEKLPFIIKEHLETFKQNDEEIQTYLAAIFEDCADLNLHHLWQDETDPVKRFDGIKPLADMLAKKLKAQT